MKLFTLAIAAVLLFAGCQKNQTAPANNLKSISDSTKAINLGKSDSAGSAGRPIKINSNCKVSGNVIPRQGTGTYTIVGRFPATTVGNISTVLPKTSWVSPNGLYKVVNQPDGNLVLYKTNGEVAIWGTVNTFGKNTRFQLQTDINMVGYSGNTGVWNSQTQDYSCSSHTNPNSLPLNLVLAVMNDGNLAIIADGTNNTTIILAGSRTTGGVASPNNGSFYKNFLEFPGTVNGVFIYPATQ